MAGAGGGSRVGWAAPLSAGAFIPRGELRGIPRARRGAGGTVTARWGCPAGGAGQSRGGSGRGAAPRLSLPREAAGTADSQVPRRGNAAPHSPEGCSETWRRRGRSLEGAGALFWGVSVCFWIASVQGAEPSEGLGSAACLAD